MNKGISEITAEDEKFSRLLTVKMGSDESDSSVPEYIAPEVSEVTIGDHAVLCSSYVDDAVLRCSDSCRIWHTCLDRKCGKYCKDKR